MNVSGGGRFFIISGTQLLKLWNWLAESPYIIHGSLLYYPWLFLTSRWENIWIYLILDPKMFYLAPGGKKATIWEWPLPTCDGPRDRLTGNESENNLAENILIPGPGSRPMSLRRRWTSWHSIVTIPLLLSIIARYMTCPTTSRWDVLWSTIGFFWPLRQPRIARRRTSEVRHIPSRRHTRRNDLYGTKSL